MMKRLFIYSFIVTVLSFGFVSGADNDGISYIQKGQYQKAVDFYGSDITQLMPSDLNNLGVAYYKLGSLGKAILYTDKALKLKPDFKDAQTNLKIYRSKLPHDFLPLKSIKSFDFLIKSFSFNILLVFALAGILILIVLLFLKSPVNVYLFITVLIFEFFINGAMIDIKSNAKKTFGVVLKKTEILEGPGNEFISKAKAPEGAEFYLMDHKNDFAHIRFLNGIEGWITKNYFQTF
ncbi:MAG: tetratricopeptide repeat protein [Proteobacteria bacterium]|nr:tetratricopeptide repeat protein [Pseudomonadota bacterium]